MSTPRPDADNPFGAPITAPTARARPNTPDPHLPLAPVNLPPPTYEVLARPYRRHSFYLVAWIAEIVFALLLLLANAVFSRELGEVCLTTCLHQLGGVHETITALWWVWIGVAVGLVFSSVHYRRRRRRYMRERGQLFESTRQL